MTDELPILNIEDIEDIQGVASPKDSRLAFWETLGNISVIALIVIFLISIFWYIHSTNRLSQFHVEDESIWEVDLPRSFDAKTRFAVSDPRSEYLIQEWSLQNAIDKKRRSQTPDWLSIARDEQQMASIQRNAGQIQKAEVSYADAISILSNHDAGASPAEVNANWANFAACALANRELVKAESASQRAVSAFTLLLNADNSRNPQAKENPKNTASNKSIKDKDLKCFDLALITLAESKIKLNKLGEANLIYDQLIARNSITTAETYEQKDLLLAAKALARKADIARYENQQTLAFTGYKQAYNGFEKISKTSSKFLARCSFYLGIVSENKRNWTQALANFEKALKQSQETGQENSSPFAIALKRDYANCLWHSNPIKALLATIDALNALDEASLTAKPNQF